MEHSDKWGHQKNVQFSINPEPSFFRKKVFIGKPSELGHALNQWHLSNIDKETLDKFLLKSSINFYK